MKGKNVLENHEKHKWGEIDNYTIFDRPFSNHGTGSGDSATKKRTLEQSVGTEIRQFRRQIDVTVAHLAHAAGISTGMLSKIENGQISPSLATLQALATALNTPLGGLFKTFDERQECTYVQAGQGTMIERRGTKVGHQYELLGHGLSSDIVCEPYLITLKENAKPHTIFRHDGLEYIYMLGGEVIYRHADRLYELKPGDSLLFDSTAVHGPEQLVKRPATYLSIIIYSRNGH